MTTRNKPTRQKKQDIKKTLPNNIGTKNKYHTTPKKKKKTTEIVNDVQKMSRQVSLRRLENLLMIEYIKYSTTFRRHN